MARHRSPIPLAGLVLAGTLAAAGSSLAFDVHCERGRAVRDVEVRFAKDADGLPCAVIWQSTVGSDRRELVWRSASQLDFCTRKVRELAHRLIDGGWMCESDTAAYASRPVPAPTAGAEPNEPEADAVLPLGTDPNRDGQATPPKRTPQELEHHPDQALLQIGRA